MEERLKLALYRFAAKADISACQNCWLLRNLASEDDAAIEFAKDEKIFAKITRLLPQAAQAPRHHAIELLQLIMGRSAVYLNCVLSDPLWEQLVGIMRRYFRFRSRHMLYECVLRAAAVATEAQTVELLRSGALAKAVEYFYGDGRRGPDRWFQAVLRAIKRLGRRGGFTKEVADCLRGMKTSLADAREREQEEVD